VSFVTATLLAMRSNNFALRLFYTMASVWLGTVNFLTWASLLCWLSLGLTRLAGLQVSRRELVAFWFALAIAASIYGLIHAAIVRVRHVTVRLPGLPASWRGRQAALVTDTHLGHVHGHGFLVRVLKRLQQLEPDVVFISGDLFDGTRLDAGKEARAWETVCFPHGVFFVTGNHDEFLHSPDPIEALRGAGIRVLDNEKVTVEGLQILGVNYRDSTDPARLQSILQAAAVDRSAASILLSHVPHHLPIAEQAGISLQLSGHTHGGQFLPFTWITQRIFRQYTHGLHQHGAMAVYTSTGAGTWGPPMRVGTSAEVVLIRFE
jgi:predicted MPP superfamily phosphohydrolase